MSANLPPEYYEAEKIFRAAKTTEDKIRAIEEMIRVTPRHKGTDKILGKLRQRIKKLKEQAEKKAGPVRRGFLYGVKKEGAAQVMLVGLPNSGKSALLDTLTNAQAQVAPWPFTTRMPQPGMMTFENIQVQMVDLPPLGDEASASWLPNVLFGPDGYCIAVDTTDEPTLAADMIREELARWKIALRPRGDLTPPEEGWRKKHTLVVGTKVDEPGGAEGFRALEAACGDTYHTVPCSIGDAALLEGFRQALFEALAIMRIYTKSPGKKPDMESPFILEVGSTVLDAAAAVHKDFAESLKAARLWGSGKFDGQQVQRDYVLHDGDILELRL
ncbi:TGS domain-containing protein [Nitrospinae bacterium AH_259_B05_G02_I21]|nr:TGS domain-containing protein [Nitrospinae bacterium AH_259_B05_G02_I21]MDA2931930.1 TGS domain-containing protein [Nitrospinae bacterium AH-259-F20]